MIPLIRTHLKIRSAVISGRCFNDAVQYAHQYSPVSARLFGSRRLKQISGLLLPGLFVLLVLMLSVAQAEKEPVLQVKIADPFVELHTGAGSRYPIFHVIDRGSRISILKQRTNWIKIRGANGEVGWVSRDQIQKTLLPDGENLTITEANQSDFARRQWIFGVAGGEFEGAPILSIFTAYSFTENLSAEVSYGQSVGNVSGSTLLKANLVMQPFPEVSYSPFFTLGVGNIKVKSAATLISSGRRDNSVAQVGIGIQHYLNRRFIFRFDFSEYIVFSANNVKDKNEEISEWKAGFAVFF